MRPKKTGVVLATTAVALMLYLWAGLIGSSAWAQVNQPPIVDAGPDQEVYQGDTIILEGTATDPDGDRITAYQWEIVSAPEGSSPVLLRADQPNAILDPDLVGDYILSFAASDGSEWSTPDTVTVRVHQNLPPTAVIHTDVVWGFVPLTVQFDGSGSIDPEGRPLRYLWDFGDGDGSSEISPSHVYHQPTIYIARLRVTDDVGQNDITDMVITVRFPGDNEPPTASPTAEPTSGPAPLTVQFAAHASDPNGDPVTYAWDFGDPDSPDPVSSEADPVHTYTQPGTYEASLTVTDGLLSYDTSLVIVADPEFDMRVTKATIRRLPKRPHRGTVSLNIDLDPPEPDGSDLLRISCDGITLVAEPFSAFKARSSSELWVLAQPDLLVQWDKRDGSLVVVRRKANLLDFDPANGADIEVHWGYLTVVDHITLETQNDHVWTFSAED
jgi:PKD repeat protein